MKIIISPRQNGKTTKLIQASMANPDGTLVVYSCKEAARIRKMLIREGYHRDYLEQKIVSYNDLKNVQKYSNTVLYVDNAEFILQQLLRSNIAELTMSSDDGNEVYNLDKEFNQSKQPNLYIPSPITPVTPNPIDPFGTWTGDTPNSNPHITCLHDNCQGCKNGICSGAHMISCFCDKCSPKY